MEHGEFHVKGHRFGNKEKALLRVNLRGAFFGSLSNVGWVDFQPTLSEGIA